MKRGAQTSFPKQRRCGKALGIPIAGRRGRTKPKNVSFLRLYRFGFCRLAEPKSFANRNEQRGKAIYPQGKTENGSGKFDTPAPDSGADTFALHQGAKQRRLQDIPRYDEQRKATHPSQSCRLGVWHSYSAGLPRRSPQLRHADFGGRYSDRKHRQDDGTFVHCQHANLCPNHRPKDCKGYGHVDTIKKDVGLNRKEFALR